MKVLMITGDRNFKPGNPRYELQRAVVEELAVVYWGRGALLPRIPRGKFDVVTAQDPFWRGHLAWHIARLKGATLNIQVHTDLDAQSWFKHVFAQIQLRHADSVRVVSERIKAQVLRMVPTATVHVLPIFIDIAPFKAVVPQVHAQKTILWIGRFEEEKNPRGALEVLEKVRRDGFDARLIMLGAGSMLRTLKHHAQGWPVEFPGWKPPQAFLGEADVALSTSWHESWGASIVEALAAGVPVVAPDIGIAKEAGAIVVARAQLAEAVKRVLESGERGVLKLSLPTAEAWASEWKKTLQ